MKLVRYGAKGAEKPGLIDKSGQLRDLSAHIRDLDGEAFFELFPRHRLRILIELVHQPRRFQQLVLQHLQLGVVIRDLERDPLELGQRPSRGRDRVRDWRVC